MKGDRVVVYLPVISETIVITLAIARIGAIHSLVFGGFSAEALKFRVEDTGAKLLVPSDGQFRRGKAVAVKANANANADEAVSGELTTSSMCRGTDSRPSKSSRHLSPTRKSVRLPSWVSPILLPGRQLPRSLRRHVR